MTDSLDFSRLVPAHKVVGVLPGRGHRAYWRNFENGVPNTEEIIGWLVTQHGDALPFTSDGATAENADLILAPGDDAPTEA